MRAKNEYKFLAEAYNTKLILERVVDGKLMCPEACCGSPVMECKCGPDCPHCNCHEIQKLAKEEDAEEFDGPGMQWDGIDDISAERWSEEWDLDFNNLHPELNKAITEFQFHLANMEDASVFDLKDIVDEIVAARVIDDDVKIQVIGYLKQRAQHAGLEEWELTGEEGIFSDVNIEEDAEEPKRGISGYQHTDALAQAAFARKGKTHKPYVSSYVDIHTGKKVFDVLDKHGTSVFRTRSKLEAYKWFKTNYSRLNEDAEEFDKEEDYWTPELTDKDKIKDHGPVIKKGPLTPEQAKQIDTNRAKIKASKKPSRHEWLNRPGQRWK